MSKLTPVCRSEAFRLAMNWASSLPRMPDPTPTERMCWSPPWRSTSERCRTNQPCRNCPQSTQQRHCSLAHRWHRGRSGGPTGHHPQDNQFSLSLDESTIRDSEALLLAYARFQHNNEFVRRCCFVNLSKPPQLRWNIYTVEDYLSEKNIPINIVSTAADGAPTMMGRQKGVLKLFERWLSRYDLCSLRDPLREFGSWRSESGAWPSYERHQQSDQLHKSVTPNRETVQSFVSGYGPGLRETGSVHSGAMVIERKLSW